MSSSSTNASMHAVIVSEPGGPDVLVVRDVPTPSVGAADVLIEVAAAGLNGADLGQRHGTYPSPPGAPEWPGLEVSGVVTAVGDQVSEPRIGDLVCALVAGGGYAQKASANAGLVLPVPAGIAVRDAAALPEAAATVWSNVFMLGKLQPHETLLVHGGSSGIGSMAIQLAVALGSRVIATAGSAEKVAFCESLGATGINYREDDFVEAVRDTTQGRGTNVILDMVGGDYLARNVSALATGGRIMVIANQSQSPSTFSVGSLMGKRGRIWGTTLRSRPLEERVRIIAGVRDHVWPLLESGSVRPVIDSVFPLENVADAHRRLEAPAHIGKILLEVDATRSDLDRSVSQF